MSSSETEVAAEAHAAPSAVVESKSKESILDIVLRVLSSVRFGIIMLSILLGCCMIGMLVMQVEVDGFQEYYQRITPSQRMIYGALGFFNIYHSWYFNLLLAITGLNIVLASIDRFPTAWQYIAKPKLKASPNFIRAQMFSREYETDRSPREFAEQVVKGWKRRGLRSRVTEENNRITVFAQKNVWNRLGAYVVHVALITMFIGGFLTSRYGVGGMMEIQPGKTSRTFNTFEMSLEGGQKVSQAELPFSVECTDLQQKLIVPEGSLEANNTIDWLSYIKVKDGDKEVPALVHLNTPFDYRGYRFFQSQFTPIGNARTITVSFESADGKAIRAEIARNGSAQVEGIGLVKFTGFYPDFAASQSDVGTVTGDYNNPVAQLEITTPDGQMRPALAFNPQLAADPRSPALGMQGIEKLHLIGDKKIILRDFEKVSFAHTLAVQYDPGRLPFYYGSALLVLALCGVFFFSHQRVWAVIEPNGNGSKAHFGGNTNRNRPAFEARFNSLVDNAIKRGGDDE